MRTKAFWIIGSAVAAVALLSGFGRGGCGGQHHGAHDPARAERFIRWKLDDRLSELDATDAQKQKIHAVADGVIADGKQLLADQKNARATLVGEWDKATPDRAAVHALVDQRLDAFRAFAHKVADAVLEVHATLTPEQRKQVSEDVHARMGE